MFAPKGLLYTIGPSWGSPTEATALGRMSHRTDPFEQPENGLVSLKLPIIGLSLCESRPIVLTRGPRVYSSQRRAPRFSPQPDDQTAPPSHLTTPSSVHMHRSRTRLDVDRPSR
jgi:hypothetical protein